MTIAVLLEKREDVAKKESIAIEIKNLAGASRRQEMQREHLVQDRMPAQGIGIPWDQVVQAAGKTASRLHRDAVQVGLAKNRLRRAVVENQVDRHQFVIRPQAADALTPLSLVSRIAEIGNGIVDEGCHARPC